MWCWVYTRGYCVEPRQPGFFSRELRHMCRCSMWLQIHCSGLYMTVLGRACIGGLAAAVVAAGTGGQIQ